MCRRGRLAVLWRLNPLHVAEGCQPCAVGALRSIVESQSAACRGRLSAALSLAEVRHAGVSIRCMSRKAVSLLEYCRMNPAWVSIRCMSRKAVSPYARAADGGPVEPGLNPLHVAEGCQPQGAHRAHGRRSVSIRCMSRKAVSQTRMMSAASRKESQSAACRGRLSAQKSCAPRGTGLSQSAACRGRLSATLAAGPRL